MSAVKIIPDIYWVGAVDWNVRTFHGNTYSTNRGTTYNAYLIMDDKIRWLILYMLLLQKS